jgi:hypothetical protein
MRKFNRCVKTDRAAPYLQPQRKSIDRNFQQEQTSQRLYYPGVSGKISWGIRICCTEFTFALGM